MASLFLQALFFIILFGRGAPVSPDTECYPSKSTTAIPVTHLFHTKKVPLVIGHRGEIQQHQENSLEGMQRLIQIKADGMHMQVQLTKDKRLILFGEDDLERMTGEDFAVDKLPYSEIAKMRLQKKIKYGDVTKTYKDTARIPLLVEVLDAVRGSGLLIYIELVPGHVPPKGPADRFKSLETGLEIGKVIRQMQMENQVFVVSRDPFKLVATAHENPHIALGWWVHRNFFSEGTAAAIRKEFIDIPGLRDCYQETSPLVGAKFMEFVVETGIVQKAVNASVIDFDFVIYDNRSYLTNTTVKLISLLKAHYNIDVSPGSFDVFNVGTPSTSEMIQKNKVVQLVRQGLTRMITDDVNKLKVTLARAVIGRGSTICIESAVLLLSISSAVLLQVLWT